MQESFQSLCMRNRYAAAASSRGTFQKGHGDYHQPDEAISLKRVEMALVIYIKGILEICRKVKL